MNIQGQVRLREYGEVRFHLFNGELSVYLPVTGRETFEVPHIASLESVVQELDYLFLGVLAYTDRQGVWHSWRR